MEPLIEITADGSGTLRSAHHGDTYHSLRGAVGEAKHVFVESGFLQTDAESVRILEMGFGTGLNAWLTLLEAERRGRRVEYTAVELYPVAEEIAARLDYTDDRRFMAMHRAPWGGETDISDGFRLRKLHMDFAVTKISGTFDVAYYDAFAPDTQPELWTAEVFARVFEATAPGGILVTYSAKGDVRRALQAAGFKVEKLPGALGKRHMLRGTKL